MPTDSLAPTPFFGGRAVPALLAADAGTSDAGAAYGARAVTNRYAPGGAGGEAIFTSLYLVVTVPAGVAASLAVTPVIDGYDGETLAVALAAGPVAATRTVELGLSQPFRLDGVEVARFAPRGASLQVRIDVAPAPAAAGLVIEGVEVEYEVVRETQMPPAA